EQQPGRLHGIVSCVAKPDSAGLAAAACTTPLRDVTNRRSVARITHRSVHTVACAAYARLSRILSGTISLTYTRSGSNAVAKRALSATYRIDASSVTPGTSSSTRRCSALYDAT